MTCLRRELVPLRRTEGLTCATERPAPHQFREAELVEAAGVEPASENTSSQITTCVSPFSCRGRLGTEPSAPAAIPDMSHCHASGRNVAASLLNDDQSRAVDTLKLIAHWLLSSESVVCVRSYVVFPRD